MKNPLRTSALVSVVTLAAVFSSAQKPQRRITQAIDNTARVALPGTLSPRALPANDVGAMPADTRLQGITLVFSRSAEQQAALDALIAAQQNPASPQFHQWLTPAQFGAQFGAPDSDIAAVQGWLQQQGFTIEGVANSRDRIRFSGNEGQVESAFGTQIHYFKSALGTHFTPAAAISVPSAIASSVLTITNLSDFGPHPHIKPHPAFTSSQTGNNFTDPLDLATIYDVSPAYSAGYTGVGQSIAIIGQSAVVTSDITTFQTALGLTAKTPTFVFVPGAGTSVINPRGANGDELESDLDLEYSSTVAPGATIYFVYTGSNTNFNVFDSLQYAVDTKVANIISSSYGDCETDLGSSNFAQLNAILAQAATEGITVISAAGDTGSTDCDGDTSLTFTQQEALTVDFPASSQYVTGIGGTEFTAAASAAGNTTYWTTPTGSDVLSSAKQYIPEQAWNDDAFLATEGDPSPLASGGGGASVFAPRPTWQTGVTGIPAGSFRLVPDISLDASFVNASLIFCSSDSTSWFSGQTSSCTSGLRDSNSQDLTEAGGTSFGAPTFAGMLAIINQAKGYTTGQGVINPTLYTLASNAATYASAFHDITLAGNQCLAGSAFCSTAGAGSYASTVGYDEATGLGSLDVDNLINAWPSASTSSLIQTTTTLTAATLAPAAGAADVVTITVAPTTATGTVTLTVDSVVQPPLTLTAGVVTYSFSSTTVAAHVINAVYSGSLTDAPSSSSIVLTVGGSAATGGAATLTASNITVTQGSTGSSTLTVTPSAGYTGTFTFVTIGAPASLTNACASDPADISITGASPGTSTIAIYTNTQLCPGNAVPLVKGATGVLANGLHVRVISGADPNRAPHKPSPLGPGSESLAAAGLLVAGFFSRRSRKLRSLFAIGFLAVMGAALSGCSNGSTANIPASFTDAPKGTYALSISGQDTVNSTVAATANFTLTVQ